MVTFRMLQAALQAPVLAVLDIRCVFSKLDVGFVTLLVTR